MRVLRGAGAPGGGDVRSGDSRAGEGPFKVYNHHDMDWSGVLPTGGTVYGWCGFLQPTAEHARVFALRFWRWAFALSAVGAPATVGFAVYEFSLHPVPLWFLTIAGWTVPFAAAMLCWSLVTSARRLHRSPTVDVYRVIEGGRWSARLACLPEAVP